MKISIKVILIVAILFLGFLIYDFKSYLFRNTDQMYPYSYTRHIICKLRSGHSYREIRTPRMSDMVGGYYCLTPEEKVIHDILRNRPEL